MNTRSVSISGVLRALRSHIRELAGVFLAAVALLFVVMATTKSYGQSNTSGAIYGKVSANSSVVAEELGTGYKRSVNAGADGSYRIGALPPGTYKVMYTDTAGAAQTAEVEVAISSSTQVGSSEVVEMAKFVVGGMSVNPVDFSSTEAVSVFNEKQIDILPIPRDPTNVALLAPGTTLGDSRFGNLASFGGASVAENAYFLNGFNVSNFRNGLDPATIPFEFYNQFEVKTGAYSAEFGRSTGGVINATSKSGSNEFHAGASIYYSPNELRANNPSIYYTNTSGQVVPYTYNDRDYSENYRANIYASGPLWKNKLFFYGLYELRDAHREDAGYSTFLNTKSNDPFWAGKIDFIPFNGHRLEYTAFHNTSRTTSSQRTYDFASKKITGQTPAIAYADRGGNTSIGRYTGTFGDNFTISAMYGVSKQNLTDSGTEDSKPFVYDGRSGSLVYIQGNPNLTVSKAEDQRKAMRLDLEYAFDMLGHHRLRAGADQEHNLSKDQTLYSGDSYFRYYAIPASGKVNNVVVPSGTVAAVRKRIYRNGGQFKVNTNAMYVEDNWTSTNDRFVARIGVRSESFKNLDAQDKTFIEIKNQLAPRIGLSYDLFGNQKTKLFANYGRYHLPVASNTNVRLAGGEYFTEAYYALSSIPSDMANPPLTSQLGTTTVYSDGSVHDRREIVDMDIRSMYQDEYVIGFQHALTKDISIGMRAISRKINGTAMDDMIVDHALTAWAHRNGFPAFDATGEHAYVLANPGQPIHMYWDFNGNGTLDANENATLTVADLKYPSATRSYYAVETFIEKVWDGKWNLQGSYTWSQTYGNYEGWVLSDIGQDDAGITQMFDSPNLTNNTYGWSPNDRRHSFKVFGAYQVTKEVTAGLNMLLQSGRPLNKIGVDPTDTIASGYGASYLLVPRGSAGRTGWEFRTDLSVRYQPKWLGENKVTFAVDVINVFNTHTATYRSEIFQNAAGGAEPTYGLPASFQTPRYFRLSASYEY